MGPVSKFVHNVCQTISISASINKKTETLHHTKASTPTLEEPKAFLPASSVQWLWKIRGKPKSKVQTK